MRAQRILATLAIATAALGMAACSSKGSSGDSTIPIGIKFDQPGLGLKTGDTYSGFDVDVATYIAGKLGYSADKIKWTESPSSQRETLISTGQVKLVVATYSITDKRKETVSFGGPYFVAGQSLLVSSTNTTITDKASLAGKKLCSVSGSTSAQKIKTDVPTVNLQEFNTYSECVTALASGGVDAVTTDNTILAGYASQDAYKGKVKLVGQPFSTEKYGVGLKKGDTALCNKVNDALKTMVSDGSWQKFVDKNFGPAGFTPGPGNPPTPEACS